MNFVNTIIRSDLFGARKSFVRSRYEVINEQCYEDRIAIVSGLRLPLLNKTAYRGIPAVELGRSVVQELVTRNEILLKLLINLFLDKWFKCPKHRILPEKLCLAQD